MRLSPVTSIVVTIVVVEGFLLFTDTGPNVLLVAGLVVLASGIVWLVNDLGRDAARPHPAPPLASPTASHPDLRITTLRQALATGGRDRNLTDRIRGSLVELVDDELLANHGIDRHHDPDAARAVLDPALQRFIEHPDAAQAMTTRSLAAVVTLIEAL